MLIINRLKTIYLEIKSNIEDLTAPINFIVREFSNNKGLASLVSNNSQEKEKKDIYDNLISQIISSNPSKPNASSTDDNRKIIVKDAKELYETKYCIYYKFIGKNYGSPCVKYFAEYKSSNIILNLMEAEFKKELDENKFIISHGFYSDNTYNEKQLRHLNIALYNNYNELIVKLITECLNENNLTWLDDLAELHWVFQHISPITQDINEFACTLIVAITQIKGIPINQPIANLRLDCFGSFFNKDYIEKFKGQILQTTSNNLSIAL